MQRFYSWIVTAIVILKMLFVMTKDKLIISSAKIKEIKYENLYKFYIIIEGQMPYALYAADYKRHASNKYIFCNKCV